MDKQVLEQFKIDSIPNTRVLYFEKDGETQPCVAVAGEGDSKSIYEEELKKILGVKDSELAKFSISAGAKALSTH